MVYERLPWHDRFNKPTPQQLRRSLPAEVVAAFDHARSLLRELDGVSEELAWYGHCWRWAIEYRASKDADPLAIVIPSPDDLQIAIPLDRSFLMSLPLNRLKRSVRDGLDLAQEPFDTNWGVWSISQGNLIDDLGDLLERKHRHLRQQLAG
jgi:hypothetical protein